MLYEVITPCPTFASGRTDAGVHAEGQVAHFDCPRGDKPETIRNAINFHIRPKTVAVLAAEIVPDDFHARFSCLGRSYVYRILNRAAHPALDAGRVWWVTRPLDARAMHEAAQVLVGRHDFTSFRAVACQSKSPVKTLDSLEVSRYGEIVEVRITSYNVCYTKLLRLYLAAADALFRLAYLIMTARLEASPHGARYAGFAPIYEDRVAALFAELEPFLLGDDVAAIAEFLEGVRRSALAEEMVALQNAIAESSGEGGDAEADEAATTTVVNSLKDLIARRVKRKWIEDILHAINEILAIARGVS